MKISIDYNTGGNHEVIASVNYKGKNYSIICLGLSSSGEAFFEENLPSSFPDEIREKMKNLAYQEIRRRWNFDGSDWSEPVDKPNFPLSRKKERNSYAIVRTAFHGGGVVGYARTLRDAEEWVDFLKSKDSCYCGCFGVVDLEELDEIPTARETRSPYSLAK